MGPKRSLPTVDRDRLRTGNRTIDGVVLIALGVLCILVLVFLAKSRSPSYKGAVGESEVARIARRFLPEQSYKAFHNVYLASGRGSTQVDHIFVSRFGVFVVETKNMTGWIFGKERDRQWTQKIFQHTNRFQNPLRQNFGHVRVVARVARIPMRSVHSVVAFVGDATLITPMPSNVTVGADFVHYIESFSHAVFSESQVDTICERISSSVIPDTRQTRRAHVRQVRNRLYGSDRW